MKDKVLRSSSLLLSLALLYSAQALSGEDDASSSAAAAMGVVATIQGIVASQLVAASEASSSAPREGALSAPPALAALLKHASMAPAPYHSSSSLPSTSASSSPPPLSASSLPSTCRGDRDPTTDIFWGTPTITVGPDDDDPTERISITAQVTASPHDDGDVFDDEAATTSLRPALAYFSTTTDAGDTTETITQQWSDELQKMALATLLRGDLVFGASENEEEDRPEDDHQHEEHNEDHHDEHHSHHDHHHIPLGTKGPDLAPPPSGSLGLESTRIDLDPQVRKFIDFTNEVTFKTFSLLTTSGEGEEQASGANLVYSPLAATAGLALLHLGAEGHTAEQLNSILQFDENLSFNPHLLLRNLTAAFRGLDSVAVSRTHVAASTVRALFADKNRGKILDLYKLRAKTFHEAQVMSVDFHTLDDYSVNLTNSIVKKQTKGAIPNFLTKGSPRLRSPLSLLTADVFQVAWRSPFTPTELNFIHLGALSGASGRRLVPVAALSALAHLNAGYDPKLDATGAELPLWGGRLSLILLLPGKPGEFSAGGLPRLEGAITARGWNAMQRMMVPRLLRLQAPLFRQRSTLHLRSTLETLGVSDVFHAALSRLKGLNGKLNLHLTDVTQINEFAVGVEDTSGSSDAAGTSIDAEATAGRAPLLRFERPFLYALRDNPTGLLLTIGRYIKPSS